jgi:hypothetical protein
MENIKKDTLDNTVENAITTNIDRVPVIKYDDFYSIICPYCSINIIVMKNELNCRIFRCGQYIKNGAQIPPHLAKNQCDDLVQRKLIYGCSKPFRLDGSTNDLYAVKCGYI